MCFKNSSFTGSTQAPVNFENLNFFDEKTLFASAKPPWSVEKGHKIGSRVISRLHRRFASARIELSCNTARSVIFMPWEARRLLVIRAKKRKGQYFDSHIAVLRIQRYKCPSLSA